MMADSETLRQSEPEAVERESAHPTDDRLEQLAELFPEAFSEGQLNIERLCDALGRWSDDRPDRYSLSWAGKRDALRLLQMPSRATLLPLREESVNFDATDNVLVEGDNLEVLKLLYNSYAGRIKMIYIDPPYNTGKDFIYPDNYVDPLDVYLRLTGQTDEEGNLLVSRPETTGRYHSAWLSMMYPRLFYARQLLREDGAIFVHIDDREIYNLRFIMNEIFGEENHLATFVWINEGNIDNQSKIKRKHEYIVVYCRNERSFPHPPVVDPNIPTHSKLFKSSIENTIIKNGDANPISEIEIPKGFPAEIDDAVIQPSEDESFWPKISEPIVIKDGEVQNNIGMRSGWSSKNLLEQFINNDFSPIVDSKGQRTTFYLTDEGAIYVRKRRTENQSHVLSVLQGMGTVQGESTKLESMDIIFDYPKPTELIKYLVEVGSSSDDLILDFFAGSCPLAEAVYELNHESQDSHRRFILVQLPEPIDESAAAREQGLESVADIGKARIHKVIDRYTTNGNEELQFGEDGSGGDYGVRIFELASSNYQSWTGSNESDADALAERMESLLDPLKPGWSSEAVIFELLMKEGLSLTSRINTVDDTEANTIYRVSDRDQERALFICLDNQLDESTPQSIGLEENDLFICRDIALSDELAANLALQCRLKTI